MRFCPFCAAENVDETTHCAACARRLPPARKPSGTPAPTRIESANAIAAERATSAGSISGTTAATTPRPASAVLPPPSRSATPSTPPPLPAPPVVSAPPALDLPRLASPPVDTPAPPVSPSAPPAPPSTPPDSLPLPDLRVAPSASLKRTSRKGTASASNGAGTPTTTEIRQGMEPTPSGFPPVPPSALPESEMNRLHLRPMPLVPDAGLFDAARYAIDFARARWQRRAAITTLEAEITHNVAALDGVLGDLGRRARTAKLENRSFAEENRAIDAAEKRRADSEKACAELTTRRGDENARNEASHKELATRVDALDEAAKAAARDQEVVEAQRRGLREKKKDLDRQQKTYLKQAADREAQAEKSPLGDTRAALRKSADELRRDAAKLDGDTSSVDRKLAALEKPVREATTKAEQARAELETARKALENAREGHRHRLAEIEAEQGRASRELSQADAEILRRMVTLGTLANLHRVDRPEFVALFGQIDELRAAIGAREQEIDRLKAERDAFDRASLIRGAAVLGGGVILLITVICVVVALV